MQQHSETTKPIPDPPSSLGLNQAELHQLLDLARWAPSGDNCQPWRVRFGQAGDCLEVLFDRSQKPAFLDTNFEASRIAVGTFAENCRLAASSLSVPCEITFSTADTDEVWARLVFAPQRTASEDRLVGYLTERVSNRRLYEPGSCTEQDLGALASTIADVPGVELKFFTQAEDSGTIAQAVALTERVRMQHRQCHVEFHQKVRWTAEAAERNPTGFYVRTFEINAHEALVLRLTRSYRAMRCLNFVTRMSTMAANLARRQVLASGAVGMLAVADHSAPQLMEAGRALQRLWLAATERGLAFQVLAVAPVFIRRQMLSSEDFTPAQQRLIEKSRQTLASVRGARPPEDIALLVRLGRAPAPSARTGRLPAEAILLT